MSTDTKIDTLTGPVKNSSSDLALSEKQWLAGLIDGDGYFSSPKNGYPRFEITMDASDKKVLSFFKNRYHSGSIKQISNGYAFKYKLKNTRGLTSLIKDINGLIRNPARLLQIYKVCKKFHIELEYCNNLTFNNG
jgi:hypothetical protein